jgi:hypothetical protein
MNMNELFDEAEQAFLEERYNISNEEGAARVRSAPDMGGAMCLPGYSHFEEVQPRGIRYDN